MAAHWSSRFGARRGAKHNAGTSGKHRNEPGGPFCPTAGRTLLVARGVARCLKWPALRRNSPLSGGQNRLGEMGQYQGPLV